MPIYLNLIIYNVYMYFVCIVDSSPESVIIIIIIIIYRIIVPFHVVDTLKAL